MVTTSWCMSVPSPQPVHNNERLTTKQIRIPAVGVCLAVWLAVCLSVHTAPGPRFKPS